MIASFDNLGPPDLQGHGVASWLCEPGGMVNRLVKPMDVTAQQATQIIEPVDALMRSTFGTVRCCYVHDFSRATGYTTEARQLLTEWGLREQRAGRVRAVVIVPPPSNRLFLMGVSTALAVLRVGGMHIELAENALTALRNLQLTPRHRATVPRGKST